jgi:hypothetical protein
METIIEDRDYDVDSYLLHYKKPEIALEVKWRNSIKDISEIQSKLMAIDAKRHLHFVQDRTNLSSNRITIMDVSDL